MSKSNAYLNVSKSLETLCSVIRNFKALMLRRKKKRIKLLAPCIKTSRLSLGRIYY